MFFFFWSTYIIRFLETPLYNILYIIRRRKVSKQTARLSVGLDIFNLFVIRIICKLKYKKIIIDGRYHYSYIIFQSSDKFVTDITKPFNANRHNDWRHQVEKQFTFIPLTIQAVTYITIDHPPPIVSRSRLIS